MNRIPELQPWRLTPALRFTLVIHAAAALLAAHMPALWPWALGMVLGNHLVLTAAVFLPRSSLLGPNMTRLPAAAVMRNEVALTFDDGPDPDITPKVLDLLARYGARASFFCIAERVAAYPELAREIVRRGHSLENHTHSHSYGFALFGIGRLLREVGAAQHAIHAVTGSVPRFFRAPVGFRSPLLALVTSRLSLCHVSWTRRGLDVYAKYPGPVVERLLRDLAAGDILLLHDGCAHRPGSSIVLEALPQLLERMDALGLRSVTLHEGCQ